jgi:hypothetical protein
LDEGIGPLAVVPNDRRDPPALNSDDLANRIPHIDAVLRGGRPNKVADYQLSSSVPDWSPTTAIILVNHVGESFPTTCASAVAICE